MKYVVMQCTNGYAVLMDEEGKFVFAANLNYTTGQTVTNPVIMSDKYKDGRPVLTIVKTIIAAAACIGVISIPCYSYYSKNLKPCSTVTFASDSSISMTLNSTGKVLSIESDNDYVTQILEKVDIKGKDNIEVANEILKTEITEGRISAGDTVDVYVEGPSEVKLEDIKSKLEAELPKHDIKVNIHDKKKPQKHGDKNDNNDKPVPEKPVAEKTTATEKADNKKKPVRTEKTTPVEKPVPPVSKDEPIDTPSAPAVTAPTPDAPPVDVPPVDTPPVDTPPVVAPPSDTPAPPIENATLPHVKPDDKDSRPHHQDKIEGDRDRNEPIGIHTDSPDIGGSFRHIKK